MTLNPLLKKALLGLLALVMTAQPLATLAQSPARSTPDTTPGVFANSFTYETLFSGYIFQALRGAMPEDTQIDLLGYEVRLRDGEIQPEIISGSGDWSIRIRTTTDEITSNDTLTGSSTFSIALLPSGTRGSTLSMTSQLTGSSTRLDFLLQASGQSSSDGTSYEQRELYTVQLSYNGVALPASIERVEQMRQPAFDLSEMTTTTTINRGGTISSANTRLASRFIDADHSEVWINTQATGIQDLELRAHFWESTASRSGFEYVFDQYELTSGGELIARLAAPGTLRWDDAGVQANLTVVDGSGNLVPIDVLLPSVDEIITAQDAAPARRFSAPRDPAPHFTRPDTAQNTLPSIPVLAMPLFGPCGAAAGVGAAGSGAVGAGIGTAVEVAGELADFFDGLEAAGIAARSGDARAVAGNVARGGARSAGIGIVTGILTGIIANDLKNRIDNDPSLTPAQRAEAKRRIDALNWLFNAAVGLALATTPMGLAAAAVGAALSVPGGPLDQLGNAIADAVSGSLCNADPYFTQPDIRRRNLRGSPSTPIEVLFLQHGSYAPPDLNPPVDTAPLPVVEYRDNPVNLIAGAVPAGATPIGAWLWDESVPFNGLPSHRSDGTGVHYFIGAEPFTLTADEQLIQYVYIDPASPPQQLYVQVYTGDGNGEQRVYWGQDIAQTGGTSGSAALYPMGPMPASGKWLRLRIPADALQLGGQPVTGLLYGVVGGRVWWGTTTSAPRSTDTAPDILPVNAGVQRVPMRPGVQVGLQVAEPGTLSAMIITSDGTEVSTLLNSNVRTGFHAVTWDGTGADGQPAPDGQKLLRLTFNDRVISETPISPTPVTAQIVSPGAYSVIRGNTLPIIGLADGEQFREYILEYGEGDAPDTWTTITRSRTPANVPVAVARPGFAHANLGTWNVGIDEFGPYRDAGLEGLYTLRLRVLTEDGSEVTHDVPVVVGRLALFAIGNTITSPDGVVSLTIPPATLRESIILLGILPTDETQPGGLPTESLPSGSTPVSTIYEVLPPNDTFLQPITLEVATTDAGAGLMLGDGTPNGWRALPSEYDAERGVLRATLLDFGGGDRALIGAFTGEFTVEDPPLNQSTVTAPALAPRVTSLDNPVAFYEDFVSGNTWNILDQIGTRAEVVSGEQVNLPAGRNALRVERANREGARFIQITDDAFDAASFPLVTFGYRVQPGDTFNLLAQVDGRWLQVNLSGATATSSNVATRRGPLLIADGNWHDAQIDLYRLLRDAFPQLTDYTVTQLAFGQLDRLAYEQVIVADRAQPGQAYDISHVAVLRPTNLESITLALPDEYSGIRVLQNGDAITDTNSVTLPLDDGFYLLPVQGVNADGSTSPEAYYPIVIDRTAPVLFDPYPAEGGAGTPWALILTVGERYGYAFDDIAVSINNAEFVPSMAALNLSDAQLGILIQKLEPAPLLTHGTEVSASITRLVDYAGNTLTEPFEWRFLIDIPSVQRDDLRQVSTDSATSPTLSPDGSLIGYISDVDGQPALTITRTDDPTAIITTVANGRSLAWSADGEQIAFVQRTPQGDTLQVAPVNVDGVMGEATPLLSGVLVESPAWAPDSTALATILDGNVVLVDIASGNVVPLTADTERPYRAAVFSPDGRTLALAFDLYERRLELLTLADGSITALTNGQDARQPAWLNTSTVLYTAPSEDGSGTQVWQIQVDGSSAQPFNLEAPPGTSDQQVAVSGDGGTLAFVSTRGGQRHVWVQRALQIADLRVQPDTVQANERVSILYTLPAEALVTLSAAQDTPLTLVSDVTQARGTQRYEWDTTGLPEGVYRINLIAQIGDTQLERSTQVRIGNPPIPAAPTPRPLIIPTAAPTQPPATGIGRLEVNAYRDLNSSLRAEGLVVEVFNANTNTLVESSERGNPASIRLSSGLYDVRMRYLNADGTPVEYTFAAVEINTDQTTPLSHPAATGEIEFTSFAGAGITTYNEPAMRVYIAGDRSNVVSELRFATVLRVALQEGNYDVEVSLNTSLSEPLTHTFSNVQVQAGRRTVLQHVFASGRVRFFAFAADGISTFTEPAITAYAPGDRETVLASARFANPLTLTLPVGSYDFVLTQSNSSDQAQEHVFSNIQVSAGDDLSLQHTFPSGRIRLSAYSTQEVRTFNEPVVSVYAPGDRQTVIASARFANPLTFVLPAGQYDFVMSSLYSTDIPDEFVFENVTIAAGESIEVAHTFPSGRIRLHAQSAEGIRSFNEPVVTVYAPGDRATPLTSARFNNPLTFVLPAGQYDFVMTHSDSTETPTEHVFENIAIAAGETIEVTNTFPSGRVRLGAESAPGVRAFVEPLVTVYAVGDRTTPLASARFNNPLSFVLPVGAYDFVMQDNPASTTPVEHLFPNVEIVAGEELQLTHNFNNGRLRFTAVDAANRQLPNSLIEVYAVGSTQLLNTERFFSSGTIVLPAGAYDIVLRYGNTGAEQTQRFANIMITAGEETTLEHRAP